MVSNPFSEGLTVTVDSDVSDVQSGFSEVGSTLEGFEGQVAAVGAALAGLSAGGLAQSISAAGDFEQSMSESMAVVGDVSTDLEDDMGDLARTLASETPYSAEEAASGYYYLASAGMEAEEQIEALPDVMNFAAAGQMEVAQASDYATDIMSAFGYEAEDLDKVMDVLSATFSNHNQTAEGMGEAMSYVAPVASEMGVEIEEASAAVGMLGDVGIKGSKAGTTLRQSLSNLASPTAQQAELLEDLGVQVEDSEGNMLGFTEIIGQLEEAGVSSGEVMELFGTQAGPGMQALISEGSEALDENTQRIEESGGITEEVAENQLDNFNSQWGILKSNIQEVFIAIGSALLPTLTELVEWLSDAVLWVQDINEATDGWAGVITLVTGLITGLTMAGYSLVSMFGGLAAVKATGMALLSALGGVLTGVVAPVLALTAAVAALGIAFKEDFGGIRTATMQVVEVLQESLQPAIDWLHSDGVGIFHTLREAVGEFVEFVEPHFETVVGLIRDGLIVYIETMAAVWQTAFDVISEVVTTVWENVLDPFLSWFTETIVENLEDPIEEAQETFEVWSEKIDEVITWVWDSVLEPFLEWFDETVSEVLERVGEWWDEHGETVMEVVDTLVETVRTVFEGFISTVSEAFSAFFSLLRGDWDGFRENISSIVDRLVSGVVDLFEWLWDNVTEWVGELVDDTVEFITTLDERIIELVTDMVESVVDEAEQLYDDFTDWISDTMDEVLETISETDVLGEVQEIIGDAVDWLTDDAVGDFLDAGKDLVDAIVEGIKDAPGAIKDAVEEVAGPVLDLLPSSDADEGPFSNLTGAGEAVPETLASGATGSLGAMKDALGGMEPPRPAGSVASSGSYQGGDSHTFNIEVNSPNPEQAGDNVMTRLKREFDSGL